MVSVAPPRVAVSSPQTVKIFAAGQPSPLRSAVSVAHEVLLPCARGLCSAPVRAIAYLGVALGLRQAKRRPMARKISGSATRHPKPAGRVRGNPFQAVGHHLRNAMVEFSTWLNGLDHKLLLEAHMNGVREEKPLQAEFESKALNEDWRSFRKALQSKMRFTKATNEWGNFHLKQPFGIFAESGHRLGSSAEVLAAGLVLIMEGGQWFWPPVRVGYLRRLQGTPYQLETQSVQPVVFRVRGFLREEECEVIIAMGKSNMSESPVVPMDIHKPDLDAKEYRTSTQARISSSESPLLQELDLRISNLTRVPVSHNEEVQVLRYRLGEFYAAHNDNFDPEFYQTSVDYIDKGHRNRLLTVFWYLTNVEKGGETNFPRANALPQPQEKHGEAFSAMDTSKLDSDQQTKSDT
ncbi:Probable prolyl 4-hydroxylase 4 (AtP4H4) [Durusdinium trenchii]|uniref:Probable prolyl 4-hydroxylase 4 (AtP4H4) n=1 Tax=Durusdinium trenchii TaxID=1381693 RepID=A0ABP0MIQ4_9DINO